MEFIGIITGCLNAGIALMEKYDHYKRNAELFKTYINVLEIYTQELSEEKLHSLFETEDFKKIILKCKSMMKNLAAKFDKFQK